jgi:hypothetical protein
MFEIRYRSGIKSGVVVASYNDIGLAKDFLDTMDKPVGTYYGYNPITKKVFFSFAYETENFPRLYVQR